MILFLLRRLIHAIVVILLVTFGASALVNLIPGSVAAYILGPSATAQAVATLNRQLGLNRPLLDRYFTWMGHAIQGNFGTSLQTTQSVGSMLVSHVPVTLEIAIITLILSLLVAIPLAMLCASRPDGFVDRCVRAVCAGFLSVPSFVGCVLLTLALSVELGLFPSYGWVTIGQSLGQNLSHAALTIIVLFLGVMPLFLRVLRADLVAVMREDYILVARARGLPNRYIMLRHALRPASLSLFTLSGLILGWLVGGSIILETYFDLPGIGYMIGQAVQAKDVPVIQGVVVIMAVLYVLMNTAVDIGYRLLDPRVAATQ